jgi:hypothetical protein
VSLAVLTALPAVGLAEAISFASGAEAYMAICAACHGPDGSGRSTEELGFDLEMPDFTDCEFAPREGDSDWLPVVARGGPARAFSTMMPAMGEALSEEQMQMALNHIRTFCPDRSWPRGELNFPRALYTTKAFPEDEVVFSATYEQDGLDSLTLKTYYEKRVGARNQWEVVVPLIFKETLNGQGTGVDWETGLGDIALAGKRVLYHSLERGAIVSAVAEVILPTGDEDKGFGSGTAVIEPFIAYGQALPMDMVLQVQAGGAIPWDGDKGNEEVFGRVVLGRTWFEGYYGRAWSPMIGLLAARELTDGTDTLWDVSPQLQVTLSTRQHLRLGLGARVPVNKTHSRGTQYTIYLLWDWYDGGFFEGW